MILLLRWPGFCLAVAFSLLPDGVKLVAWPKNITPTRVTGERRRVIIINN